MKTHISKDTFIKILKAGIQDGYTLELDREPIHFDEKFDCLESFTGTDSIKTIFLSDVDEVYLSSNGEMIMTLKAGVNNITYKVPYLLTLKKSLNLIEKMQELT